MLHKFYVGSRGSFACVQIYGRNKSDAISRLRGMAGQDLPFVHFDDIETRAVFLPERINLESSGEEVPGLEPFPEIPADPSVLGILLPEEISVGLELDLRGGI